jgi:hypothetical protein
MQRQIYSRGLRIFGIVSHHVNNKMMYSLTATSFFSFVSIPLEILLFVVEHYKTATSPSVAPTNGEHMATHALTEQKEEERIGKSTSLGTFPAQWPYYQVEGTTLMFVLRRSRV